MVTVRIPTVLREVTGGSSTIDVEGATVREVLGAVSATHPAVGRRIFDEGGAVRRFVNVFVDDEDIRFAEGLETQVSGGQVLSVLPAVAGGNA
jgi:molybdopterin synthase sulfur carrier subunit